MLDAHSLTPQDLQGLSAEAARGLAEELLHTLAARDKLIAEQAQAIKYKDARHEKVLFELARLKRWKFAARTEHMNPEQRRLFEEAMAEDEASLQAQLEALLAGKEGATSDAGVPAGDDGAKDAKRAPRRQALPEHLRREDHHHEPADTNCPGAGCGAPMVRMGEDVSERLDIVPAEFFVHRHIRGKWVCRCCQILVQEVVDPQIIDKGIPTAGLVAHTMVSHFVDHLPYYRLESINARSGVHTPRSTLAAWSGQGGAQLEPLFDAHRTFVLGSQVLHVDETPVAMLDPGAGKTQRAYVWAYARGAFDATPGVVYDFRTGRAARHAAQFLRGWSGTLVCDAYAAYETVARLERRTLAGCAAHARRKFEELAKATSSTVAAEALRRFAWLYMLEREAKDLDARQRLAVRQAHSAPAWHELHVWLQLERQRVPDGSAIARAIDYSLNNWRALTHHLGYGQVAIDNNHCENLIRPWAMGRKAWLFAGSELAGQRAAMVMSLLQSAKLHGHSPWAYLKDVLERLPTHLNSRIDELLPHCWRPAI